MGAATVAGDAQRFPFVDVAERSGLAMQLTTGASPARQIVEVKGGGVALIDRDNDGDWDVFVPNGATLESPEAGPGCRLFDNRSDHPGGELAFVDVTAAAGLSFARWGVGVAVGDVDGDGFDDLYVTSFGENALLVNDGAGHFIDRTVVAGVGDRRWGTGCSFGDLDLDGDLDLYVVNYLDFDVASPPPGASFRGVAVFGGPAGLPAQADVLYANRGDGIFADVTELSGCAAVPAAHGLNVVILDIDRDGRQEILVGNDSMPNRLLDDRSTPGQDNAGVASQVETPSAASALSGAGPWTRSLVDRGLASGLSANAEGHSQATMGFAIGDVDGNGLPDVYSTNFSSDSNTLHLNVDGSFFDDRTARFGLGSPSRMSVGWAASFQDFDLDGDEDLLVFNGHVYSQAAESTMDSPARQRPLLFARGAERFTVVEPSSESWLSRAYVDRSAAFGDLDGDGDVDVVVGERDGPLRLLRNDSSAARRSDSGTWLAVRLEDRRPGSANHRGLGAEVSLLWEGGRARRWIVSGGSYLSASEPVARFGLSEAAQRQTLQLEVRWPDGFVQRLDGVGAGELLVQRP
ncbi:MAG: hypothetical protein ACI9EF_002738 [Pseudohongiellaceae bacterium]|jgi:hypothetical protein